MATEISNPEKAALALLSLGKELATQVMQNLTEAEVKAVSRAFLSVSGVDRETQFTTARDFLKMLKASDTMLVDGRDFAKSVIAGAFGEAQSEALLEYISGAKQQPIRVVVDRAGVLHAGELKRWDQDDVELTKRVRDLRKRFEPGHRRRMRVEHRVQVDCHTRRIRGPIPNAIRPPVSDAG